MNAAAQWHGLQQCDAVRVEAELVTHHLGGARRQRVLAQQCCGDERFGQAGAFGDLGERQVFAGFGQKDDFAQGKAGVLADLRLDHGISPWLKDVQATRLG
ncbi:hypothetical protein D3C79_960740 [compost metagenome]